MSEVVNEYVLPDLTLPCQFVVSMPEGAEVLGFKENAVQQLVVMAIVDVTEPNQNYDFYVAASGQSLGDESLDYVNSVSRGGGLHFFEVITSG